jgi:hypothetical protein
MLLFTIHKFLGMAIFLLSMTYPHRANADQIMSSHQSGTCKTLLVKTLVYYLFLKNLFSKIISTYTLDIL